jgi:large subunit ribosomal protein L21
MYAVIRSGGKQYRVAPGDVIRVDSQANGAKDEIEFSEVLAVSSGDGHIAKAQAEARVVGHVVERGRADKILVFHYKRKKQYKKIAGHRQPFTAVRITEIAFDGQRFTAPELPRKQEQPKKTKAVQEVREEAPKAEAKPAKAAAKKRAPVKKPAAKKSASKKKK